MATSLSGLWEPTEVSRSLLDGTWAYTTYDATELVSPTSVSVGGGSASITGGGTVVFTGVTSLSLNGVFSSQYTRYQIVLRNDYVTVASYWFARLRASGTDDASTSDYGSQQMRAEGSTASAISYVSEGRWRIMDIASNSYYGSGCTMYVFDPYVANQTQYRTITADSYNYSVISDNMGFHLKDVSYDGITLYVGPTTSVSGHVAVYGMR